jgi:hypothetical protein
MDAGRLMSESNGVATEVAKILRTSTFDGLVRNSYLDLRARIFEIDGSDYALIFLALTNFLKQFRNSSDEACLDDTYTSTKIISLYNDDPSNPDVVFALAMHWLANGEHSKAEHLLDRLSRSNFHLQSLARQQLSIMTNPGRKA